MKNPSPGVASPGHPTTHPAETSRAPAGLSPAPASDWRERLGAFFASVLIALALVGCGSSQAGNVLRAENDYSFFRARYAEQCPEPPTEPRCIDLAQKLRVMHGAVQEASEALKRGGDCPLQIERLRKLAKEYPR